MGHQRILSQCHDGVWYASAMNQPYLQEMFG